MAGQTTPQYLSCCLEHTIDRLSNSDVSFSIQHLEKIFTNLFTRGANNKRPWQRQSEHQKTLSSLSSTTIGPFHCPAMAPCLSVRRANIATSIPGSGKHSCAAASEQQHRFFWQHEIASRGFLASGCRAHLQFVIPREWSRADPQRETRSRTQHMCCHTSTAAAPHTSLSHLCGSEQTLRPLSTTPIWSPIDLDGTQQCHCCGKYATTRAWS